MGSASGVAPTNKLWPEQTTVNAGPADGCLQFESSGGSGDGHDVRLYKASTRGGKPAVCRRGTQLSMRLGVFGAHPQASLPMRVRLAWKGFLMRRGLVFLAIAMAMVLSTVGPATAEPPPEVVTMAVPFALGSGQGDVLRAELDGYLAHRGFVVELMSYAGNDELFDMVQGADPPDMIISAQPGTIRELAGSLVDLTGFINPVVLRRDFSDYLVDSVTVDGAVLGGPVKADLKTLVWYRPGTFEQWGYQIPQTWDELIALSDTMVADGHTPWCNFLESGFATGWLGTDWIEDLLLGSEGPQVYDQWVEHEILFQDPRVEEAFERFFWTMDTPGYVWLRPLMTSVSFVENVIPLAFDDCLMHRQGSFFAFFIDGFGFDRAEFSTFRFPSVATEFNDSALGGGNYVAVVTDNVWVRQLTRFMLSNRFGTHAIADSPGWILPNVRFNTALYADAMVRDWAEWVQAAVANDTFRFDGSDLMPIDIGAGLFWQGVADILDGVKTIQEVLFEIDQAWPS